jgi:hypothetical protein
MLFMSWVPPNGYPTIYARVEYIIGDGVGA